MIGRLSIEDRLEIFAEGGLFNGFTLCLWNKQADHLLEEGIILSDPKPTGRKGEYRYKIDFSHPSKGTLSERLYLMACEARGKEVIE